MGIPPASRNTTPCRIHHLDPDTSIIAVIGGGISGLSTVLQILIDQEKAMVRQPQQPAEPSHNDDNEEDEELHTKETSDEMGTNGNHHLKTVSSKNKKNKKKIHRGRLCRTIHIYEKHPDPNQQQQQVHHQHQPRMGYGLTITYQPDGTLSKSIMGNGILDDITNYDCPSRSHYILNQNGTILGYYGNAFHSSGNQGYGQRGNIRIPRQILCQLLLQKIQSFAAKNGNDEKTMYPNIEIFYNHTLRTIQEVENGVTTTTNKVQLIFDTDLNQNHTPAATTAIVDLVIAADGIHSTVVREWLQHPPPPTIPTIPSGSNLATSFTPQPLTNNQHLQHRQILLPPPKSLNVRIILGITDDLRNIITAPSTYRNTTNGAASMHHELIRECGFYTLSNGHRLFVMPYTGSTLNRSYDPQEPVRFMWQLSFIPADTYNGGDDRADGSNPHSVRYTSSELHNEALQRTTHWHEPVTTLIYHTSTSNVWGTMLRDRNPSDIGKLLLVQKQKPNLSPRELQYQNPKVQRVIIIGDAMHGMSPFKGQGANQCFKDAICVSKWLYKLGSRNLTTAIQFMTREIIQRTAPIVLASRQAAEYWHTMDVNRMNRNDVGDAHRMDFTFAGIDDNDEINLKHQLLIELHNRNINAGTTQHLDETIRAVITELARQVGNRRRLLERSSTNHDVNDSPPISDQFSNDSIGSCIHSENGKQDAKTSDQSKGQISALATIIDMAYSGTTGGLRKVSWYQPNYLRQLKIYYTDCSSSISVSHHHPILWNEVLEGTEHVPSNANWTTILHVAVIGAHPRTIHWLITEAGCNLNDKDSCARTAFDIFNQYEITQGWCTDKKRYQIRELLLRLQPTGL